MKSSIAEHIKGYLLPALHPVVDARVEEGIKKYGQTLDDNVKPERAKAVHQLQELLDAMKYRRWRSTATVGERFPTREQVYLAARRQDVDLSRLADMANEIIQEFPDLTLDEMLFREGHSGAERQGATPAGEALEQLREMNREMIVFWRSLGNPMLRAAAQDLEEKLDALLPTLPTSAEGEAKAEQATGSLIQAGTLGHRLLSALDVLGPESTSFSALLIACMPDYHPDNTAQALEGMRDLGLVTLLIEHRPHTSASSLSARRDLRLATLLIEHSEAYTVRMTDAGRAALAAAGGEA